jgi:hypothetical protein
MERYSIMELTAAGFVEQMVHSPNRNIEIVLTDGNNAHMSIRSAILHSFLWRPYLTFGIPITLSEIYDIRAVTVDTISKIQTIQYKHLMEQLQVPHMDIVAIFWEVVNTIYRFTHIHLARYQRSISLMSLINVVKHPAVAEIIDTKIPVNMGTKVAEFIFNQQSAKLMAILESPDVIKDNPMLPFMASRALNKNQIPQLINAYGPRSDLDDQMMKHVINESALSGLRSPKDLATESLSAKKTAYYNSEIIAKTQYFARVLRLMNMQFRKMYPGDCGSRYMLPHTIQDNHTENYIHKVVYLNGNRIEINEHNHKELGGMRVEMISPVGCRYEDGVCERCAGRATKHPWAYVPQVHLGSYAKSKLSSRVSQNVLSAKHLIKTSSIEPSLPDQAKKYFTKVSKGFNIVFAKPIIKNLKNLMLVVSAADMNHISDLMFSITTPEGFSSLDKVVLLDIKTKQSEVVPLDGKQFMIHLSKAMLVHMKDRLDNIELLDGMYYIPLEGFPAAEPALSYVVVNADMVAFSKRIRDMISTDICAYTSVGAALTDLSSIIYSKTGLNIFWLELIIKSLMEGVIDESGNVVFRKIRAGIINTSVATKLGHEHLKKYLSMAETTVVPKGDSPLDLFFGFN